MAPARGPWNQGQGPWGPGESWEYIDDPITETVQTRGQMQKSASTGQQTQQQVEQANRQLSQQRSEEIKRATPIGQDQWSSYPA